MSKYTCEDLMLASAITGYGVLDLSPSDLVEKIASDIAQVRAEEREKAAGLVEALQAVARHDISVGNSRTKGPFGIGMKHPILGVNPNGTRWATPKEIAEDALATYNDNRKG